MIRRLKQSDRLALENMLKKIPNFKLSELNVALELIDIAIINDLQSDYNVFVYEEDEKILGYHCTGKRPLTDGTYDLYWIVVDPDIAGKGVGSILIKHAENFVKENNGRWLLAETSSKESYGKTRDFYLKNNYKIVSEIKDFYSLGDSLIVFGKFF